MAGPAALAAPPSTQPAPPADHIEIIDKATPQQTQALLQSLLQEAGKLMQTQKWDQALAVLNQISTIAPNNPEIDYNRACCQARLGDKKHAIATLAKSVDEGFAEADHMADDSDLAALHDDPQFDDIVARSRKIPLSALSPQEKVAKAQQDYGLMSQQMQSKDWSDALTTSDELMKLAPKNGDIAYNRACVLARLGKKKEALEALNASIDKGFTDYNHIRIDDDLQSLRDDPDFTRLVDKAKKVDNDYSRFPAETTADIPEVKTIEDSAGPDGMPYRIRMSKDASAEHPDRLVIWFHPSGASMDNIVEALSPKLAKHHLALLVFPQKSFLYWTPTDVDHVNKTLEAVGKIPGVNSKQPLAVGFSAGGQMMLQLYNNKPSDFGGLVLDSAYPIAMTDATHGKLMIPPADAAVKKTPILAIVGGADQNGKLWIGAESAWKDAGVPLTLVVVPDGAHQWLFDNPERQKMLIDWLADVNAGKLPGAATTEPATQPGAH
jgi:regulator of sirC expression with transglutaminase-like and TPR domain/pimeloyl-ACP methyl ester carboxylesterase